MFGTKGNVHEKLVECEREINLLGKQIMPGLLKRMEKVDFSLYEDAVKIVMPKLATVENNLLRIIRLEEQIKAVVDKIDHEL